MNAPDARVAEEIPQLRATRLDRGWDSGYPEDSAQCKHSRAPVRARTRSQSCLAQGRACQAGNLARSETGMTVGRRGVVSGKGGETWAAAGLCGFRARREREREGGKDSESVPPPV